MTAPLPDAVLTTAAEYAAVIFEVFGPEVDLEGMVGTKEDWVAHAYDRWVILRFAVATLRKSDTETFAAVQEMPDAIVVC